MSSNKGVDLSNVKAETTVHGGGAAQVCLGGHSFLGSGTLTTQGKEWVHEGAVLFLTNVGD